MKLIDILAESMADGNAFKAFVSTAIAKKETQANEGLNSVKQPSPQYANGRTIQIGDNVNANLDGNKFPATVDGFRFEYVLIVDSDGNVFQAHPWQLIHDE